MGGKKILYALMLLALVGMVQADIATTLTQNVSPTSGTQSGSATPTFTCYYFYNTTGRPTVLGAYVAVLIDGKFYFANYSPNGVSSGYIFSGATLSPGNHTWYCNASASGYQAQVGPTQSYFVRCPAPYCSGAKLCTYTGPNPTCIATCYACPSGQVCSGGACAVNTGGGGSPLLMKTPTSGQAEPVAAQPADNTGTFAIIIIVIVGLGIAYFIARSYLAASYGRKED